MKPTPYELQEHLKDILIIPERIKRYDNLLKKELLLHTQKRINRLLILINNRLLIDKDYDYPKEYLPNNKFKYWAERTSQQFNYSELQFLREVISNSFKSSNDSHSENIIFYKDTEKDIDSEAFFQYLVNQWLLNERNKRQALKCIFFNMLAKNQEEIPYKIISKEVVFGAYWTKKYSSILIIDTEKPRLNEFTDTKDKYYQNKFNFYLNEYTKGKRP